MRPRKKKRVDESYCCSCILLIQRCFFFFRFLRTHHLITNNYLRTLIHLEEDGKSISCTFTKSVRSHLVFFFSFQHLHHYNGVFFFVTLHCTYGASGRALFFLSEIWRIVRWKTFGICWRGKDKKRGFVFLGVLAVTRIGNYPIDATVPPLRYTGILSWCFGISNG